MYLAQFFTVAFVHLLAVMSPGPDFAVITRNSLVYSRKSGIFTSLGLALGIVVHVTYCLLGIGVLISKSIILFNTIKFVGALYLIYIGYKSIKAKPQIQREDTIIVKENILSNFDSVKNGFLTNVLNPKATLFFLALFTQVINPATPFYIQTLYGLEMVTATFVWFSFVSVLFSNDLIRNKVEKFQHYIEMFTGVVLIGLGIKVALSSKV